MKWRKCSHKCPDTERDVYVIIKLDHGSMQAVARYEHGDWYIKCDLCKINHDLKNVTYWAELVPTP